MMDTSNRIEIGMEPIAFTHQVMVSVPNFRSNGGSHARFRLASRILVASAVEID
jgi:hypothetical protein